MTSHFAHLVDTLLADSATGHQSTFLDYQLDWHTLFGRAEPDATWLVEPFIAAGRAHALYAPAKVGKSLLALHVAAAIASGRPILDQPARSPMPVIYCDYEMTPADVLERLEDMGYETPDELEHLHYVQLPDMAALNVEEGGQALAADIERIGAALVVIDTTGRAVNGPENDADTYLDFYRHTGRRLKATGCSWMRLDHAGKNLERGQRGTSAKNDDVDVVWQLTRTSEHGFRLQATHRRMGWVPATVNLRMSEDPVLGFTVDRDNWSSTTVDKADLLDRLGVPLESSIRGARKIVTKAGEQCSSDLLRLALNYRRSAERVLRNHAVHPPFPASVQEPLNGF